MGPSIYFEQRQAVLAVSCLNSQPTGSMSIIKWLRLHAGRFWAVSCAIITTTLHMIIFGYTQFKKYRVKHECIPFPILPKTLLTFTELMEAINILFLTCKLLGEEIIFSTFVTSIPRHFLHRAGM